MSVQISKLFSPSEFEDALANGYIRANRHPETPSLVILNYTEKAAYERHWDNVTTVCRGLIVDIDKEIVIARPFHKFFNWNEPEAPSIDPEATAYAYGNMEDGSLGIAFINPYTDKVEIATRGSFVSDQAIYATEHLLTSVLETAIRFTYRWENMTPLYEIIYPNNRIVLDYGDKEELVSLGFVHRETGAYVPPTRLQHSKSAKISTIMADVHRDNAEGWVIWLDQFNAVKVKQDDYVELHRIVTGLNERTIWEKMGSADVNEYSKFVAQLPDELFEWANEVASKLKQNYSDIHASARMHRERVLNTLPAEYEQKDFALAVQKLVPKMYQGLVFSLEAGKSLYPAIWKMIKPRGDDK